MHPINWREIVQSFDSRRDLAVPGDQEQTLLYCVNQFIAIAQEAIKLKGFCTIALSGGSTPLAIYRKLGEPSFKNQLDWEKVYIFWSDERSVPENHAESNFHTSLQAGLSLTGIPDSHLFRMRAETDIENHAREYEKLINEYVPDQSFDLIMLGMGDDGHTASLFPKTLGLQETDRLVVANWVPQKSTWRMTFTYKLIEKAKVVVIYVLGKAKSKTVNQVLFGPYEPDQLPIQRIGTETNRALWIIDQEIKLGKE